MAAGALLVAILCWDAIATGPGTGALMVGHVGVAAVWLGAILARRDGGRGRPRSPSSAG